MSVTEDHVGVFSDQHVSPLLDDNFKSLVNFQTSASVKLLNLFHF